MTDATRYRVFRRSARSWSDFGIARKTTIDTNLTIDEARRVCAEYNDNRTPSQIKRGTKLEFESQ